MILCFKRNAVKLSEESDRTVVGVAENLGTGKEALINSRKSGILRSDQRQL